MPELSLEVPVLGNRWAVGLAFQLHLVIVAAIMGGAIVAPVAEVIGVRGGDARWERLAHDISAVTVRFFAFGATWAVVGLVLLFGLYPALMSALAGIFLWPLLFVGLAWLFMSLSAYYYYYSWDRLRARRGRHVAVGLTFAVAAFVFIDLITLLSSFQLTPVEPATLGAAMLNPSWLAEVAHRHVGNLSYFGLILAGVAGAQFLSARAEAERAFYDWLGHLGLLLGVGVVLLQPLLGYLYATRIAVGAPGALARITTGEYSWLFLVQSFLLGAVFLLGNLYMASAIARRGEPGERARVWLRWSTPAIALLALLLIVPRGWPLALPAPWRYLTLVGLVLVGGATLALYLRASGRFSWGRMRSGSQLYLVGLALVGVALMITMGIIRESARGDDLIHGRLSAEQSQQYQAR